jgi:BirA family biotin operon repressor/biotin-[acetyl-CoA-carboxylase] ligase
MKWTIEILNETPSTQDAIKARLNAGAVEGLVIHALHQTGGRGRHGRQWISHAGNLFLSLLLRPDKNLPTIGQLGIVVGVALAGTMKSYLKQAAALNLKWPNDVLIGGKKCAGILVEMEGAAAIVGIGVNITAAPPGLGVYLNDYAVKPVDMIEFRSNLLTNIGKYYDLWRELGFAPVREMWMQYAPAQGTMMSVKTGDKIIEGAFHDMDENGNLVIAQNGKIMKILSGEIFI